MRKIALVSLLLVCSMFTSAQDLYRANLILVINDELAIGSISNVKLINEKGHQLETSYCPGTLTFENKGFEELEVNNDSLMLVFDYYENTQKQQMLHNYRLPISNYLLKQPYLIMKVFDLERKEYKKSFGPIDSKRNYSVEVIYSGGQIIIPKKSKR